MSLETFTVRRSRRRFESGHNYASEAQVYESTRIISAVPSISKKDGKTDGLVNTKITYDEGMGENVLFLWVTDLVATIEALDDA